MSEYLEGTIDFKPLSELPDLGGPPKKRRNELKDILDNAALYASVLSGDLSPIVRNVLYKTRMGKKFRNGTYDIEVNLNKNGGPYIGFEWKF